MRIAILANKDNSFVPSLAESLQLMLERIGVESKIFYEGLIDIRDYQPADQDSFVLFKKYFVKRYRDFRFYQLLSELKEFNAIVIIGHIPAAFLKGYIRDTTLRQALPETPIILYSNYYLPTRGSWIKHLKEGNISLGISEGGHYGLERYDHYLCTSVVSEYPLAKGQHPYSLIGITLDKRTLFPSHNNSFIALLDFQRTDHLEERRIQVQALKEAKVDFIELEGNYSRKKIREIYRRCSIYFVAHRESFGLPICELQACGSYIFTPYSNWCPSHWIKEDLSLPGKGDLSPNFIVYNNDKERLIQEIYRIKKDFNPYKVCKTFRKYHPQLLDGDLEALQSFIEKLSSRKISSQSHVKYSSLSFPI